MAGCTAPDAPVHLMAPSTVASLPVPPLDRRQVRLNEVVEGEIEATVTGGMVYCEIGNDPVPCARFVVDVPAAGTVTIRLGCECEVPLFIEVGNLAVEHLGFFAGASPLDARVTVPAGP
jgi:hypothetical protein